MQHADTDALRSYHDATKHSPSSVRTDGHTLDWEIQPVPYKIYESLDAIALPRDWTPAAMPALDAIGGVGGATDAIVALDLPTLARVLHLTAGIVRKAVSPDGHERYFRAAACTGALYHVDLYVICGALPGLDAGVYHFSVHDFALRRLRTGDQRGHVVAASGTEPAIAHAPVVLAAASTYWRNAWKYQARAYRHCFWDSGTLLANLLAVTAAVDLPTRVVLGFVDQTIDVLLGLDTDREAPLALVALGANGGDISARAVPALPIEPLSLPTVALSTREVDYPAIRAAHAASALAAPDEVRAMRNGATPVPALPAPTGETIPLRPSTTVPGETIDAVIRRRGSSRQFAQSGITFEELSTMLVRATGSIPMNMTRRSTLRISYAIPVRQRRAELNFES